MEVGRVIQVMTSLSLHILNIQIFYFFTDFTDVGHFKSLY